MKAHQGVAAEVPRIPLLFYLASNADIETFVNSDDFGPATFGTRTEGTEPGLVRLKPLV